jgi:hypothetical protein
MTGDITLPVTPTRTFGSPRFVDIPPFTVAQQAMKPIDCPSFGTQAVLVKKGITSLSGVVLHSNIKLLNVDGNNIPDFIGFGPPPDFESLIISNNPLTSLKGMPSMPSIASITMRNTPFSRIPFYRIALVILFGRTLRVVDGQRISQQEREIAESYPRATTGLLRAGWVFKYPPPPEAEIPAIMATLDPPKGSPRSLVRRAPVLLKKLPKSPPSADENIAFQRREIARLQLEIFRLQEGKVAA